MFSPTHIGEFGIVHKAFFKRYTDSETEVVAVKTLKGINAVYFHHAKHAITMVATSFS